MLRDIDSRPSGLIRREDDETYTQRLSDRIDEEYQALKAGDPDGSARLYEALRAQAWNVVGFRLQRSDNALAHDIATRAFEKVGQFQGKSQFSTWFYRLAQNEVNRALREQITDRRRLIPIDTNSDDVEEDRVASANEPAAPRTPRQDAPMELEVIMRVLSDGEANVVQSNIEGYTLEEIAEQKAKPLGTVRSRYERAKEKMKKRTRMGGPKQK